MEIKTAEEILNKYLIISGNYKSQIDDVVIPAMKEHTIQDLDLVSDQWELNRLQRGYDSFRSLSEIILEIKDLINKEGKK